MYRVNLEEADLKNLNVFLDRVDMKGKDEALAMVRIVNSMANAKRLKPTEEGVTNGEE